MNYTSIKNISSTQTYWMVYFQKLLVVVCITISLSINSQTPAYFGAGNSTGITINASSFVADTLWVSNPTPDNTINGSGLDVERFEASRFLTQAAIAYDPGQVDAVLSLGMEGWIDWQFSLSADYLTPRLHTINQIIADSCLIVCGNNPSVCAPPRTPGTRFSFAWWNAITTTPDVLRQRIALALSEIMVISRTGRLAQDSDALCAYFDLLMTHSFGNYRDLLFDVTLNPSMAEYLTHINNPKTDQANFIYPDENYAREILQLFTIGLLELNMDGTQKVDASGNPIPTYDNADVGEFAKIFTGLSYGALWTNDPGCVGGNFDFGMSRNCADRTTPMIMYETQHEPGEKYLLNGFVAPAGLTGLQDIDTTMAHLMEHPNIAPFVSYRLIQRLVKSNPTKQYIQRVSQAFVNNGNGVRGDMKAIIKAILLDPEARDCSFQLDDKNSKLKEPVLKRAQLVRMIDINRPTGDNYFWDNDSNWNKLLKQAVLFSPSVFNFFTPSDVPIGRIQKAGLVAPEFKILDQVTLPGYANMLKDITQTDNRIFRNNLESNLGTVNDQWCSGEYSFWDQTSLRNYVMDQEYLINWLDTYFTAGSMTDRTRQILRDAADEIRSPSFESTVRKDRVDLLIYLTMLSPDFNITK